MSPAPLVLEAQGLGKAYRRYGSALGRFLEVASLGRLQRHERFWALRGLDLALPRGGAIGICGGNGAGKSTLLKVLADVTPPTEGRYRTAGRVGSLLELELGFDLHRSGRANIVEKGIMLGVPRSQIRAKIDQIIEFSELGEFIDQPLRTYSAGMGMRLGFSVAAAFEPELLIIDEVFAVGDVTFQRKCIDWIHTYKRKGKSILFCSHSMIELRQICDEAVWLAGGRVAAAGDTLSVTGDYLTSMTRSRDEPRASADVPGLDPGEGVSGDIPHVASLDVTVGGERRDPLRLSTGEPLEVTVGWENPLPPDHRIQLGIGLVRQDGVVCLGVGTHLDDVALVGPRGRTRLELPSLALLSGEYQVLIWVLDESGMHRHHEYLGPHPVSVEARSIEIGVYSPERRWAQL
ncbi:MAG: polysaccharide ABC transporter ATP-binding protein [Planctomycetota bacterium]